jgi:hypothetical protein
MNILALNVEELGMFQVRVRTQELSETLAKCPKTAGFRPF